MARISHRFKKKKPIYKNRFFWMVFLIIFFLSLFFYFLFFSGFFQIKKVNFSGLQEVQEKPLNELIWQGLDDKILFFPNRIIFLTDVVKIKKAVLEGFPQIDEIDINRKFPDSLDVSVIERNGVATFCFFGEQKEEHCFVLDKEGVFFKEKEPEMIFEPLIKSQAFGEEIKPGKEVITKDELALLLEINNQLNRDLNLFIEEFIILSGEKLTAVTENGWEIYFNLQGNVDWQMTKLKVLLEEKIPEERMNDLEWIELRFGNFANPKYKD